MYFLSERAQADFLRIQQDYQNISYVQYVAYITQDMHAILSMKIEDTQACRDSLYKIYTTFLDSVDFWKGLFPSLRACKLYEGVREIFKYDSHLPYFDHPLGILTLQQYLFIALALHKHPDVLAESLVLLLTGGYKDKQTLNMFVINSSDRHEREPLIDRARACVTIYSHYPEAERLSVCRLLMDHVAPKEAADALVTLRILLKKDNGVIPRHARYRQMITDSGPSCFSMMQSILLLEKHQLTLYGYYELFLNTARIKPTVVYNLLVTMGKLGLLQAHNYTQAMVCKNMKALIESLAVLSDGDYILETTQMYFETFCMRPLSEEQAKIMKLLLYTPVFKDVITPENALKLRGVNENSEGIRKLFHNLMHTRVMLYYPQRMFDYVLQRWMEPSTTFYCQLMDECALLEVNLALDLQEHQDRLARWFGKYRILPQIKKDLPEYLKLFLSVCRQNLEESVAQSACEEHLCQFMKEVHQVRSLREKAHLTQRSISFNARIEFAKLLKSYREISSLNPYFLMLPKGVRTANELVPSWSDICVANPEEKENELKSIFIFYDALCNIPSNALFDVRTLFPSLHTDRLYQACMLLRQHSTFTEERFYLLTAAAEPLILARSFTLLDSPEGLIFPFVCYRSPVLSFANYYYRPQGIAESFLELRKNGLDTEENINFMACHDDPIGAADTFVLLKEDILPERIKRIIKNALWNSLEGLCVSVVIRAFQYTSVFTSDASEKNVRALLDVSSSGRSASRALRSMALQLKTAGLLVDPHAQRHFDFIIREHMKASATFVCCTVGEWPTPTFPQDMFETLKINQVSFYREQFQKTVEAFDEEDALKKLRRRFDPYRYVDVEETVHESLDTLDETVVSVCPAFIPPAPATYALRLFLNNPPPPEQDGVALGVMHCSSDEFGDEELLPLSL